MSRQKFQVQSQVLLDDILLDEENPRIRAGKSQKDCIARVLRKEDQMLKLIRDLAENGLSTIPILIAPKGDKWVVKDGNRRVTALKVLANPDLCLDNNIKKKIQTIHETFKSQIVLSIDCLSTDDPKVMANEILRRHSGELGGVGQIGWSPYLRTIFLINNGHPVEYRRAGQYLMWAEERNVPVDDDFPITNVTRFFNIDNLRLLGFASTNEGITPLLETDVLLKMATIVIQDFGLGRVTVNDVYTADQAKSYILRVRKQAGLVDNKPESESDANPGFSDPTPPTSPQEHNSPDDASSNSPQTPSGNGASTEGQNEAQTDAPSGGTDPTPPRTRSPVKPSWDRKKLFGTKTPGIDVPTENSKVTTIIAELRMLNVQETPFAVTMLFRALIELSTGYFLTKHNIQTKDNLSKDIASAATKMESLSLINNLQLQLVQSYTKTDGSMFCIKNLQRFLHGETHNPNFQTINSFWDDIGFYIVACWK